MPEPKDMTRDELLATIDELESALEQARSEQYDAEEEVSQLRGENIELEAQVEYLEGAVQLDDIRPILDLAIAHDCNAAEYHIRRAGLISATLNPVDRALLEAEQ